MKLDLPGTLTPAMKGKVVLITGGTGGIGQEIAVDLARKGAEIVITGRDRIRGEAAVADIERRGGGQSVELLLGDLSSQQDIRGLADQFMKQHNRLDVLINNVGGLYGKRWETADGLEATLAINHLSPFLLTHLLLPLLRASAPSRIVNINSEGHRAAKTVDFDSFQAHRWKRGFLMYSQAKLANLLCTYEMARRLGDSQITVNALHPGIVDTPLFRRFLSERFFPRKGYFSKLGSFLVSQVAFRLYKFDSAETAAQCPSYLASSPEVAGVSGKYFHSDKKIIDTSPASQDLTLRGKVWNLSAELVKLKNTELIPVGVD